MKSFQYVFMTLFMACTHSGEQEVNGTMNESAHTNASSSLSPSSPKAPETQKQDAQKPDAQKPGSPMVKADSKEEAHHHASHHEFFEDAQFGDLKLKAHDSLFLSGEPSLAALKAMKAGNVKLYIDIRPKSEVKPEFIKMVESQGITFVSKTIFSKDGKADLKAVDEVFVLHKKNHDVGHVVGCASGVRSSAWFTLHLIRQHKMPVEEAIEVGKTAYLNESWAENIRKIYK